MITEDAPGIGLGVLRKDSPQVVAPRERAGVHGAPVLGSAAPQPSFHPVSEVGVLVGSVGQDRRDEPASRRDQRKLDEFIVSRLAVSSELVNLVSHRLHEPRRREIPVEQEQVKAKSQKRKVDSSRK